MNLDFNELPWHDANLKFLFVDRRNPGEQDSVKILIEWPENEESSIIEFYDCYSLTVNMNFGIIADESILMAECIHDSDELRSIKNEWADEGCNLEKLKCYKIVTNSTNSTINIFAFNFRLENQKSDNNFF